MQQTETPEKITMYGTPSCPMVSPMKGLLKQSNVNYEYINIMNDIDAREIVREINSGYESVPTFIFPDGSTLTEPNAGEMKNKLQSLGYEVPVTAMLAGNMWMIFLIIAIGVALLRAFGVF